jgi:putative transposase
MTNDHRRLDAQMTQEALLDDADFLLEIVERVVQEVLEAEMTQHIGAAPHERTAARKGHRNGHKPRALRTRVGTLNLLVPQDREGTFSTRHFSRYQRNEKALCLALMEMYVEGVSTRKVKEVTEALCGTSFSKSLVSSLAGPGRRARSVEDSRARSGSLPLRVRGCPLREGEVGAPGGEPGGTGRLGGKRRRL